MLGSLIGENKGEDGWRQIVTGLEGDLVTSVMAGEIKNKRKDAFKFAFVFMDSWSLISLLGMHMVRFSCIFVYDCVI